MCVFVFFAFSLLFFKGWEIDSTFLSALKSKYASYQFIELSPVSCKSINKKLFVKFSFSKLQC